MSLPNLPAGDKFRREVRTEWGGINLNENAGDGELVEAINMSSREYPLLANARIAKAAAPEQIIVPYTYNGQLGYTFFLSPDLLLYDPTHPGQLKVLPSTPYTYTLQMAVMGHRMVIAQLKKIYDFDDGTLEDMTGSTELHDLGFYSYKRDGIPGEGNVIIEPGNVWSVTPWDFRVGDAITVSGCTRHPENNKTAIVRGVHDNVLYFDDYTWTLDTVWTYQNTESLPAGNYALFSSEETTILARFALTASLAANSRITYSSPDTFVTVYPNGGTSFTIQTTSTDGVLLYVTAGTAGYHEQPESPAVITVSRAVPDMDYICVNENRMWGCKGDTIYASKLGDPLNWNVFDGLSTDSWTAETGTQGNFTGCCSYQGYPTFFKENAVFKVMGDEPSNFALRKVNIQGVKNGSAYSIVEIRSHLYYLSRVGVMQWNGGDYPQIISGALGGEPGQIMNANAGTDGLRYYLSLVMRVYNDNTESYISEYLLLTYDTRYGTWHELTMDYPYGAARFTGDGVNNWMYLPPSPATSPDTGKICTLHDFPTSKDTTTEWRVTFADSTRAYKTALTGSESKKGVLRLLIRCRLAKTMKVWISYDGGDFEEAGEFGGEDGMEKTSRVVPLILRRCDYWQLRLTGVGDAVIYSIAVEKYGGEWQQA